MFTSLWHANTQYKYTNIQIQIQKYSLGKICRYPQHVLYFFKGNGARTPETMFLSIYNHLWEICLIKQAKITRFGQAEWKSAKNTSYKKTIFASAHERARVIFLEVKKDPFGSPQKNLYPSYHPRSARKSTFFQSLAFFLAFLEFLDSPKIIPSCPSIHTATTKKIRNFGKEKYF